MSEAWTYRSYWAPLGSATPVQVLVRPHGCMNEACYLILSQYRVYEIHDNKKDNSRE